MDLLILAGIVSGWVTCGITVYVVNKRVDRLKDTVAGLNATLLQVKNNQEALGKNISKELRREVLNMAVLGVKVK